MRLTILGTASGGVPGAGDSGSGYLLEEGDARLLVDCGNGVLGRLAEHASFSSLTGVYLSHLHPDHTQDLIALALYWRFAQRGRKLPVYGPKGMRTLLYRWFTLFHTDPDPYVEAFELHEFEAWDTFPVGGLRIQACPVEHNIPSFALRAEPRAGGGPIFVYTADTRAGALVVEAAQGADVLLAEATFQDLEPDKKPEASREHHMTARQAGQVAKQAGAKRLVLTHFQVFVDRDTSVAQAREVFEGPVEAARPGVTIAF